MLLKLDAYNVIAGFNLRVFFNAHLRYLSYTEVLDRSSNSFCYSEHYSYFYGNYSKFLFLVGMQHPPLPPSFVHGYYECVCLVKHYCNVNMLIWWCSIYSTTESLLSIFFFLDVVLSPMSTIIIIWPHMNYIFESYEMNSPFCHILVLGLFSLYKPLSKTLFGSLW